MVKDRGALVEDITSLNSTLRFAYHKPGVEFDIARLSGRSPDVNINKLAGNLRFEGGATQVGDLSVDTDRSSFVTTFGWTGGTEPLARRTFDVTLHADRLSLPEVSLLFKPVAGINLAPAIDVKAHGHVFRAEDGRQRRLLRRQRARSAGRSLRDAAARSGRHAYVSNIDLQHMVNRPEWKTRITGQAIFDWTFGHPTAVGAGQPMKVNFKFAGPEAEGFGYRAENVRAQGVYDGTGSEVRRDRRGLRRGGLDASDVPFPGHWTDDLHAGRQFPPPRHATVAAQSGDAEVGDGGGRTVSVRLHGSRLAGQRHAHRVVSGRRALRRRHVRSKSIRRTASCTTPAPERLQGWIRSVSRRRSISPGWRTIGFAGF